MPSPRLFARTLVLASVALCSLPALAAQPITGVVTDKTTGKPAAGDQVVLIQLQQSMQESTRTTTDARGHFSLQVPDDGMHLVRVTHQKATYFQPVPPGQQTVDVTVYDAAPKVEGVQTGVEELHIEATATELHVVEVLQVLNESTPPRTQFGPAGFDFYLPPGSLVGRSGAITQGGMPVQTPAVPLSDPGHFAFLFPIRPGETQFGISYTLPYTGKFTFAPRLSTSVKTFAVLLPTSMKLAPGSGPALALQPPKAGTQTYLAQDVAPDQSPQFTISGIGTLPNPQSDDNGSGPNAATANPGTNGDNAAPSVSNSDLAGGRGLNNPLNESGDRDPWAKYKWWILSGLAILLAGAAGILLRRPSGPAGAAPLSTLHGSPEVPLLPNRHEALLSALKEELFALETEKLQQRITDGEYREAKSALELILGRALRRSESASSEHRHSPISGYSSSNPAPEAGASEPVLTGRKDA